MDTQQPENVGLENKTNADEQETAKSTSGLAPRVAVKVLDRKSSDWVLYHYAWDMMNLLYTGGCEIEAVAEQFLLRRSKEMSDVYQSRIERFYTENHIGTAVDWYLAALLETPPSVETALSGKQAPKTPVKFIPQSAKVKGVNFKPDIPAPKSPADDGTRSKTPSEVDDFYDAFEQNCDRAGTPVLEVERAYFKNLLLFGRACILVDLPPKGKFANLKEEKDAGQFDPFLVNWDPRQMINYSTNAQGDLDWVIFANRESKQESAFSDPVISDNWYYYDRFQFAKYSRVVPVNESEAPKDAEAELVDSGSHSQTAENRVPVIYCEVPKGLWLVNRAFSVAKEHLNTACALSWALYMACLAMPVIKMDGEWNQTLSEAGCIKLPRDSEYSWSEPEGKSFVHLMNRIDSLKEEIFRAFYLIAQSRSTGATASAQSGVSKQEDMSPSKKVLNLFGDVLRSIIQRVYDYVSVAHEDNTKWDVRGLSFPEGPPDAELDTVAGAIAIGVPGPTFEKELYKKAVMAALPDMNPKTKEKIFLEIDSAPSAADRELDSQTAQGSLLAARAKSVQAADVLPKGSI